MLRLPVLGPGEEDPIGEEKRTILRSGVEARLPLNDTVFRQAERYFKAKHAATPPSALAGMTHVLDGQLSDGELFTQFPHIQISYKNLKDFSEIPLDYATFLEAHLDVSRPLRLIRSSLYPGMLFIPNPFTWTAQIDILKCCFKEAINPPCLSNLDPFYAYPSAGLWPHMLSDLEGKEKEYSIKKKVYEANSEIEQNDVYSLRQDSIVQQSGFSQENTDLTALELIRKLRWVTIGYQYDWTRKEYIWEASLIPFPNLLKTLCKAMCSIVGWADYQPEAGIINYYQVKDTLTGHVDRSEKNDSAPLVSFSFGAAAIFLLGGLTRDDLVLPFKLRSGDLLIMSDSCRRNYHGVPKIFPASSPPQLTSLIDSKEEDVETRLIAELMKDARINLNVRQVFNYN